MPPPFLPSSRQSQSANIEFAAVFLFCSLSFGTERLKRTRFGSNFPPEWARIALSIGPGMGFPVRTKGTGNTEHMFSHSGVLWEQGTGNREQVTRRPAGPPEAKFCGVSRKFFFWWGGILKGTGNREQGTGNMPCSPSVPGTCSGTTTGKPIPGYSNSKVFRHGPF